MTNKEIDMAAKVANNRRHCFDDCPYKNVYMWIEPMCTICHRSFYKGYVMGAKRNQSENKKNK